MRVQLRPESIVVLLCTAAFALSFLGCKQATLPAVFDHDLDNHPTYKEYDFGKEPNVIDIGTQPLFFPTGLITEVLKRDLIYQEALAALNVEIRFHPFLKGRDVNHFIKKGVVDAGIGGDAPTLSAIAKMNVDVPVIVQRGFLSIVSDHPMLVEELKGKRIGYARGSNAHYALLAALEHRELSEGDVELIPMDITQMRAALEGGIVDAFSAWGPEPAEAMNTHPDFVTIHQQIGTGFLYFAESVEAAHPEVMPETVAAVIRAVRWLRASNDNVYQAADWLRETTLNLSGTPSTLSNRQIAALAERELIGLFTLPEIPADDIADGGLLHREYEFLASLGNIPGEVPWEQIRAGFREDIMAHVLESPGQYRLYDHSYELDEHAL